MSALKLATQPMHPLGITYENPERAEEVVSETGGHPSFLQFYCSSLIQVLDEKRESEIRTDHLRAVWGRHDYRAFVLKSYRYEKNLSDLEKLLVLLLVRSGQQSFGVSKILRALEHIGSSVSAHDVAASLDNLEIAGFLKSDSKDRVGRAKVKKGAGKQRRASVLEYSWTIPAFPRALSESWPVDREVEELRAKIR